MVTIHNEDFSDCCSSIEKIITPECPGMKVLKGDVNCDGVVNLLDVGPFVNVLTSGQYDVKADVNCDGVVNLLDVGPFVAILSGG